MPKPNAPEKYTPSRVRLNLEYLAIRIFAFAVTVVPPPLKRVFIDTVGLIYGISTLPFRSKERRGAANFKELIGGKGSRWLFVLRYFIERGRCKVWADAFFEAYPAVKDYIRIDGEELLREAVKKENGIIMLGAHYGPEGRVIPLNEIIDPLILVSDKANQRWQRGAQMVAGPLVSKKTLFFAKEGRTLVAGSSEKELIKRFKQGRVLYILLDSFHDQYKGASVSFFSHLARLSYFPFKVALKHGSTVFFTLCTKEAGGGYRIKVIPAPEYKTPEEGLALYVKALEAKIKENPFMWGQMKHLSMEDGKPRWPGGD